MSRAPAWLALLGLLGCNHYELFLEAGYEQENFNNNADILFVIDNSDSMRPVSEGLALSFNTFINTLTSAQGANTPRETLSDAVSNYMRENGGNSLFIDYQLAITTSSVDYSRGPTTGIDPGEAGTLAGDVVARTEGDVARLFREQLLCTATCWAENDVPSDSSFQCTENPDPGDVVSREYLDCVCGASQWKNHCGSGNEMGLEGALLALCRAVENPPDGCFEYDDPGGGISPTSLTTSDIGSNSAFLRDDATTVIVIVTDEGDGSYRMLTGDSEIEPYTEFFEELPQAVRIATIGPNYHDGELICNNGSAQPWAVKRYQNAVDEFSGTYVDIADYNEDGVCDYTDFALNLNAIGDLLTTLLTVFPLQAVPDVATIQVYVRDIDTGWQIIDPAPVVEGGIETGDAVYGDGWSYEASENAVAFHGAAVPDYNSDVKIYYRPLGGMPRTLPDAF